jgi:hypothetical protein
LFACASKKKSAADCKTDTTVTEAPRPGSANQSGLDSTKNALDEKRAKRRQTK